MLSGMALGSVCMNGNTPRTIIMIMLAIHQDRVQGKAALLSRRPVGGASSDTGWSILRHAIIAQHCKRQRKLWNMKRATDTYMLVKFKKCNLDFLGVIIFLKVSYRKQKDNLNQNPSK